MRLILILLFFPITLFGKIYEIHNLEPLFDDVSHATSKTLVLFDVDDTLIVARDMVLRGPAESFLRNLVAPYIQTSSKEKFHRLFSIILLEREISLINPQSLSLIQSFQNKGSKVICLTALKPGQMGLIPSMEAWRKNELKSLGFNFQKAFPRIQELHFEEYSSLTHPPVFYKGILASGSATKGEALKSFLNKCDFIPDQVIFVDDKRYQLESVENVLLSLNIPFTGYLYKEVDDLPGTLDERVARFQIEYLIKHEKWLSEKDAKSKIVSTILQ